MQSHEEILKKLNELQEKLKKFEQKTSKLENLIQKSTKEGKVGITLAALGIAIAYLFFASQVFYLIIFKNHKDQLLTLATISWLSAYLIMVFVITRGIKQELGPIKKEAVDFCTMLMVAVISVCTYLFVATKKINLLVAATSFSITLALYWALKDVLTLKRSLMLLAIAAVGLYYLSLALTDF